jgi:CheY-like chemotaxis protein
VNRGAPAQVRAAESIHDMKRVLLASPRRSDLESFVQALRASAAVEVFFAEDGAEALVAVPHRRPDLVVVDDNMGDMPGLKLVRQLVEVDAFIQTALMSDLSDAEYHHRSEGLGIWKRLPIRPGKIEAHALVAALAPEDRPSPT